MDKYYIENIHELSPKQIQAVYDYAHDMITKDKENFWYWYEVSQTASKYMLQYRSVQ